MTMIGGTLLVSREVNLHRFYKSKIEELGFMNVSVTSAEKDGLNMVIDEVKPDLVLMEAAFYERATPFMMSELIVIYPDLNIAAVNLFKFPDDVAMWFILYGIRSYVNFSDGLDEFNKGMKKVRDGRIYISPNVQARIDARREMPEVYGRLTPRMIEVIKLICCGYKINEIADTLHISSRTVDTHKTDIFTILNCRNSVELVLTALRLDIIKINECFFYPKGYVTNPDPDKKYGKKNIRKAS